MTKTRHPRTTMRRACFLVAVLLLSIAATAQEEKLVYSPALLAKAQNGDAEAQYKLGQCYETGKTTGVALDKAKAFRWKKAAALKGHAEAMYDYAYQLLYGFYTPADTAGYRKYILRAAEKGNENALYSVAWNYEYNYYGFAKDSVKAAGYYAKYHDIVKAKADAGDPFAMINLADLYAGKDQFKDKAHLAKGIYSEALDTYRKRAEAGDAQAASQLAWKYCWGIKGFLEPDTLQAIRYYEMAAQNKPDNPYYHDCLAELYFARDDYPKAISYARKAMECPDNERLYGVSILGHCYYQGLGVEKNIAEAVRYHQQVVDNKNAYDYRNVAHIDLANCYYYGQVVKTDYAKFVSLLDGIYLWSYPETQYLLARCYIEGKGVKKNVEKGLDIIRYTNTNDEALKMKMAHLYFDGAYAQADRYRRGDGVKKDLEKAADMFNTISYKVEADKELVEKADIARDECKMALADSLTRKTTSDDLENRKKGAYLFFGLGVNGATEQIKAEGMYRYAICAYDYNGKKRDGFDTYYLGKAAELKHPNSLCLLGMLYAAGAGVTKDERKAADYFRQAVATGDIEASNAVANYYLSRKMYTDARAIYEANAKKGSARAYYMLGAMCDDPDTAPLGIPGIADAEGAVENYTKAAEMGYAEAQYMLSSVYGILALEEEYPVEFDPDTARMWLTKAAKQGHLEAMAKLGDCYYIGALATDINYREALKWLKPAAEQGNEDAMYDLGCMYEKGLGGLPKDSVKAISLFQQSARKDNFLAKDKLKNMGLTW